MVRLLHRSSDIGRLGRQVNIKAFTNRTTLGIGRREFVRSGVASVLAALPASRLWADASGPGAIPDSIAAADLSGKPIVLKAADIKDFRASLAGRLFLRTDAGYEQARRIWK